MEAALATLKTELGQLDNEQFYHFLLDRVAEGVYFVDLQRRICFWNHRAERITGYTAAEVIGCCCSEVLMHVDRQGRPLCERGCPLMAALANGVDQDAHMFLHHKDGQRIPVHVRTMPLRDAAGEIVGAAATFPDSTETSLDTQRLRRLEGVAYIDELTGLANRRYLRRVCRARFAEANRHRYPFGVILMDVDDFERFNERHGREVGDRVLRMVARTLVHNCRPYDIVGRWGGDELLVVAGHAPVSGLRSLAERLQTLVASSALMVDGKPVSITVSSGATTARNDDDFHSLVARAGALKARSEATGGNTVTVEM